MKTQNVIGLHINEKDNVASVFSDVKKNQAVEVRRRDGSVLIVTALDDIPYGHKIAIQDIPQGEEITKYGEEIGISIHPIKKGQHVHVHNLESIRGRGDWQKKEGSKK